MEHDLTRGNVLKTIAVFALPYMLSYFLQMLYGMADLYMMGQFSGAAGITAVPATRGAHWHAGRGGRRNRRLPAYLLYGHSLYRRV